MKPLLLLLPSILLLSCATTTPTNPVIPTNIATPTITSSVTTAGVKPYPLKTCIVTDNALGSMGDEQRIVHNGQEIKFCCEPCIAKFKANPSKYLGKLG
jgi:hypothetical protein